MRRTFFYVTRFASETAAGLALCFWGFQAPSASRSGNAVRSGIISLARLPDCAVQDTMQIEDARLLVETKEKSM